MHEALTPISWLSGRWGTEEGNGKYPTLNDFTYHETLEFICIGQPMFNFVSISRHPEKQSPMHQERGFLRIKPGTNNLALVISHNFGATIIEEGFVDEEKKEITLESTTIGRISFAKSPTVKKTMRKIKLLAIDTLEVVFSMETDNTPMTEHLRAIYKKID